MTVNDGTLAGDIPPVRVEPKEVVEFTCFRQPTNKFDIQGAWVVTNRYTLEENRQTGAQGRFPRMLAMGRIKGATVTKGSNAVPISGKYYDGRDLSSLMTVTRQKTGYYQIRYSSGLIESNAMIFCTGFGQNMKGAITNQSDTGFDMYASDNSSLNDSDINFMILDYDWWFDYKSL